MIRPRTALSRVLGLRPEDLPRALGLAGLMLLVVAAYLVGHVTRDALFLHRFPASRLPLADISVFLLVSAAVAVYIRGSRRLALRRLLTGSLWAFAALWLALFAVARAAAPAWLPPAVYLAVGVFGVLAPAQVWTLANYTLTPREAKRVFGLVGGGATLGGILGGFVSSAVARRLGAESLLIVMALLVASATVLVGAVWRRRPETLEAVRTRDEPPQGLGQSFRRVVGSPELRAVAGLIAVSSFVTAVAAWQLKATAQARLGDKEALAAFFGSFNGWTGLLALAVQLVVTPRLLHRFDLGTVLFVLPAALLGGSAWMLLSGTLAAAAGLKVVDKVCRYAIDRPATELLYLPLPGGAKVAVKSFIDTVVWRLGDALAGLAVLVVAGGLGARPALLSLVSLPALLAWLALATLNQRRYVANLRETIRRHRLDVERASAPVLDRSTTRIVAGGLETGDPAEILYALDLLTVGRRPSGHPSVPGLLDHPSPEVRARALGVLAAAGERSHVPRAEALLRDPDLGVRTEALLYLARHARIDPVVRAQELGEFPDFSIRAAVTAVLARAGENREAAELLFSAMAAEAGEEGRRTRLEAARLAGILPVAFPEPLARLVLDEDREVAGAAMRSASRRREARLAPCLVQRLSDADLREVAAEALLDLQDGALPALRATLADPGAPPLVRRAVPALLAALGSRDAADALSDHLLEPDTALRREVIAALNKLARSRPDLSPDRRLLETALGAEILGHYRSYQIRGRLGDAGGEALVGLREAMGQEVERIFRLLSLLFPGHGFHSAHVGLGSTNIVIHDQSLEFLQHALSPDMKALLLPLIDPDTSEAERVRLANQRVGTSVDSVEDAIHALAGSGDPWLRSCAAYAIGVLHLQGLRPVLEGWRRDPDPLLRETVRQARARLAGRSG
jgi:AAA family ATP:ADP antiporter